jgi:hypothetical protein
MLKNIVRIMLGCKKWVSCRKLKLLPLMSQYVLSLMFFVIKNKNNLTTNSEIHFVETSQHTNFHQPTLNLSKYQKGIYYSGIRFHNNLPPHSKDISDDPKNFKLRVEQFLYLCSCYPLEEYVHYHHNFIVFVVISFVYILYLVYCCIVFPSIFSYNVICCMLSLTV